MDLVASATELYVVDSGNNRVLVFPYNATSGVGAAATRVIGQLDFPYNGANAGATIDWSQASGSRKPR